MATYDDEQGKPRFVDGEGLVFEDLNNLATKLERKFWEQNHLGGMEAGRATGLSLTSGVDPYFPGPGIMVVSQPNIAYCPFPLNGPLEFTSLSKSSGEQTVHPGIFGQQWKAGLTGTAPTGISQRVIHRMMEAEEYDIGAGIVANPAPGAGNPRWDTVGMLLGFDTGDSQTRDFEDAVTRAKTTSSTDKEHLIDVSWEYVTGSQSATYDMATLSTDYVPILTIARPVGEGGTLNIDNFYYNAYPMRLGIEDVMGYEMLPATTGWTRPGSAFTGSIEKTATGTGSVLIFPRTMHAGCRLIGFGISGDVWGMSPYIYIGEYDYDYSADGAPGFTSIVDVSDNGITNGIDGLLAGFQGVGEVNWSPTNKPLPIWGNGLTAGPLFVPERKNYSSAGSDFSKLAVKVVSNGNWTGGDKIYFARFFYLY